MASLRSMFRHLLNSGQIHEMTPDPNVVKALLPLSSFRKSGPGVTKNLQDALRDMTPSQRAIVKAKGWDKGLL